QVTSEDAAGPIEAALVPGSSGGWRAAAPGEQGIRLLFDVPQRVKRIRIRFEEDTMTRTQEFVLRWSGGAGEPAREIVRQQYNFSPPTTVEEIEDYTVELENVTTLE